MEFALWKDELYPEENVIVDLPLTDKIGSLDELADDLGLPRYVDMHDFPMKRAVVTLWACKHAHELHGVFPEIKEKIVDEPITMLLFGGAAFKVRCISSNVPQGAFNRSIYDVDFVIPKKKHKDVRKLLLHLGRVCGTEYLHFMTHHDRRFTGLQAGNRILFRVVSRIQENGTPVIGPLDILADRIEMRHTIDVRDDFNSARENMSTISLVHLLLTKTQFILDANRRHEEAFRRAQEDYRILPYPFYDKDKILVGMERKDMIDVAALLLDHDLGSDHASLQIDPLTSLLRKNDKLALTARLNLQNMLDNIEIIRNLGATPRQVSTIVARLQTVLDQIPVVEKQWSRPWWNTTIETPNIPFTAVD